MIDPVRNGNLIPSQLPGGASFDEILADPYLTNY